MLRPRSPCSRRGPATVQRVFTTGAPCSARTIETLRTRGLQATTRMCQTSRAHDERRGATSETESDEDEHRTARLRAGTAPVPVPAPAPAPAPRQSGSSDRRPPGQPSPPAPSRTTEGLRAPPPGQQRRTRADTASEPPSAVPPSTPPATDPHPVPTDCLPPRTQPVQSRPPGGRRNCPEEGRHDRPTGQSRSVPPPPQNPAYADPTSRWRRSSASMKASRSPSSTASTFPVS